MVYYTPLVLVLGALVWAFTKDLNRVISVLVVSCPCAFILATPTAMVAALSAAARLGILIKNVSDIELAARINAFIFDKTGTLTTGKLAVSRGRVAEGRQAADGPLAGGEGPGLVEDEGIDPGSQFDIGDILDQDAQARRRRESCHHRGGRRQDEGARARHD